MSSDVFSLSFLLSLLSFLMTLVTVIRVGSLHFVVNQMAQNGVALPPAYNMDLVGGFNGQEFSKMPMNWSYRKPLTGLERHNPSILRYDDKKPVCMAKLIMSRRVQRRNPTRVLHREKTLPSRHLEQIV